MGLTGGLASGKSTAARYLRDRHGLPVWDADRLAAEGLALHTAQVQERYGPSVRNPDGTLNRGAIAEIVFADAAERHWLETLLHPYVRDRLQSAVGSAEPLGILDVPLLWEAHMVDLINEVWVVFCTPAQQRQRAAQRHGWSPAHIEARLAAQWPLATKAQQADLVLDNCQDLPHLYAQIDRAVAQVTQRLPHPP
ncbi:MAG TPA: dephospho-CoA kinase [Cyanobacteria bacterium UBA8156]|nr:dephospho-CoA kinase [Cyanobacteria bacterium UBA8156]